MKLSVDYTNGQESAKWTVELSNSEFDSLASMLMIGTKYRDSSQTTEDICASVKFCNLHAIATTKGSPWNNENRSRYYGKRIGDVVKRYQLDHSYTNEGEVVGFGFMDNNSVYVVWNGTKDARSEVAEYLDIITMLEDRK